MKEDIEAQGKLKRARLDSAKNNSQLMDTNIQELGNAELRDSQVQTKVMVSVTSTHWWALLLITPMYVHTCWAAGISFCAYGEIDVYAMRAPDSASQCW